MLNFQETAPNFTYSQKSGFLNYNWNFLDKLLLPYKFHCSGMRETLFFNFASCEPLSVYSERSFFLPASNLQKFIIYRTFFLNSKGVFSPSLKFLLRSLLQFFFKFRKSLFRWTFFRTRHSERLLFRKVIIPKFLIYKNTTFWNNDYSE